MIKTKALICLAAGKSQLSLIKNAISLGYAVISVDINPIAIGFAFSTESIVSSTHDAKNIIRHLEPLSKRFIFKGILNRSSGIPVITSAEIANHFKINYYPIDAAKIILNKHLFFQRLADYKLAIPRTQIISSECQKDALIGEFPLVLKPSLSDVGKSGVIKVNSLNELNNSLSTSIASSINNYLIAQEFIDGFDVVLISFVQGGTLKPISFVEEINIFHKDKEAIGAGVLVPARIKNDVKSKIIAASEEIIKNLNIHTSPFMISFRVAENTPYLMELHLDFGGDLILDVLLPNSFDFDVIRAGIQLMAGEKVITSNNLFERPTSVIYYPGKKLISDKKYYIIKKDSLEEVLASTEETIKKIYD